ncbi:MAG: flavin reductase [Bacilli bacterium]|nr:flavin reductase [Bacilli bacterium]
MNKITNDIIYIGVNDHKVDLFEGQYVVPNGMAYNSYLILDNEITIFDTVDINFFDEWLKNIKEALGDKKPTYLVVQHMEPDHSANIIRFLREYPDTKVVGNAKTFTMIEQFFHTPIAHKIEVKEGDTLNTGKHTFTFVFAPMVHWPEVMVTYDSLDKVLFSADGFGKFGALDVDEEWDCEARRYYFGIVGKYGLQVQALLKKAATLDIQIICPLHGPILKERLAHYLNLYNIWSSYQSETDGVAIFYTSVYGHTKEAAIKLAELLKKYHAPKVAITDLAREDMAEAVEDAFRYPKIVLATTTYNMSIFPHMNEFINHLVERNYQNKTIAFIENGTWAPNAIKVMKEKFANSKNLTFLDQSVTIRSSLSEANETELNNLAKALCDDYIVNAESKKIERDPRALFNIGYGLYVITSNDGKKDNGMIANSITQVTSDPQRIAVTLNKNGYTHDSIKLSKKLNINVISEDAPFSLFEKFGFISGRTANKFNGENVTRSANGLVVLNQYTNSYISLEVEDYLDLSTHGMFICKVVESKTLNTRPTMTYTYYQNNVKPKPGTKKKGWVCKICGYVYEGENLPPDFICPLCKHPASDFEKIGD